MKYLANTGVFSGTTEHANDYTYIHGGSFFKSGTSFSLKMEKKTHIGLRVSCAFWAGMINYLRAAYREERIPNGPRDHYLP